MNKGGDDCGRWFDFVTAILLSSILFLPMVISALLVWMEDQGSPIYVAKRIGKDGRAFGLFKLRTMVPDADKAGIDTTANDDKRITRVGRVLRSTKMDEIPQLLNVLKGEMSFVGPRPQVEAEVRLYTALERGLLAVKPGITDPASIIFADLGAIMKGYPDANLAYNQLVRPWKSKLGLFYIENKSCLSDLVILVGTVVTIFWKKGARMIVEKMLKRQRAPNDLIELARYRELKPMAPPGADDIVRFRG